MELECEFSDLSLKFLFVVDNPIELNGLLNDLNGLDYKYQQISNASHIVQFIESLTKIGINTDTNIKIKAYYLIKQLISKQKVVLPEHVSDKIVRWIIQGNKISSEIFACEALDVLCLIFKKNATAVLNHCTSLLSNNRLLGLLSPATGSLQKIHSHDYTSQEVYKSILSCIESMLLHLEDVDFEIASHYLDEIGKILIKFIYEFRQNEIQDGDFMAIATSVINCLKYISQSQTDFSNEFIGELLGISRAFMFFGIPEIEYQPPVVVKSSQQAMMEPFHTPSSNRNPSSSLKSKKSTGKNKNQAKKSEPKQNAEELQYQSFTMYRTSDSDFSDNEHNREMVNRNQQAKLRLSSLSLLLVITTKVEKKILFGFWHCLFSTDEKCQPISLGNSVFKDSSPRCRLVSLQTIIQLVKNSKPYLIQAENKDKIPTTFTPFSVTLGNMISFTYDKLTQTLIKEGDLTVLAQILKCISIFITVTPFHRLRSGIVSGFVKYVRLLVRHKDPTVKVAALIVIKNLISLPEMTSEILEIVEIPKSKIEFNWRKIDESLRMAQTREEDELIDLEFDEDEEENNVEETSNQLNLNVTKMPWILQNVLENLGIYKGILKLPSIAVSVRIESLQMISAMSSHYLLLKDHLLPISSALARSFHDSPPEEKLHASRALENLGSAINNYLSQESKTQQDIDLSLAFWIRILPNIFENIQDDKQPPAFRASLADCLSNIGVHNFEKLDFLKQTQLKSILTGCCYDEDANVKSSAVRALSLYVLFPSLREDLCFIENTIECILRIMKDQNLLSRTKSSFGLANIVDSLLSIRESVTIDANLQKQIIESCLNAANDNDRVKVNAVRVWGNSILLLSEKQLKDPAYHFEKTIVIFTQQLATCPTAKVKWNICFALSSIMKNPAIFDHDLRKKWQSPVFKQLIAVIKSSPNFKVRTNACIALMGPKNRMNYGDFFSDIWECLLFALEQSNNLTDFNEYKHRDALQDQLCAAICHFLSLTIIDDVISIKNQLFPLIDVTKQNWDRVVNRLPPESQSDVLKACSNIEALSGISKSSEQKNSIEILKSCFSPAEQFL